jgi:hypothetical protein
MAKGDMRDDSEAGDESRYDEELLCTGWTPVIDLLQWSCDRTAELTRPRHVSDEEAAAFLNRIYTFGG